MRTFEEKITCGLCGKDVSEPDKRIGTIRPDLDLHGIWMGDLQEYVWLDEEDFCSFECFVKWLIKRRNEIQKENK